MKKEYLLIICISIAIIYVYMMERIKREKLHKIKEQNRTMLNKKDANLIEIRNAYEYETGKKYKDIKNDKGMVLEYKIFETMYKLGGKVLSDLFIPKDQGVRTQTDLIFVHNTGIYIIEAKNIKANLIKGDDEDGIWQAFYNKDIKPLNSPLKQNMNHVAAVKKFLQDYDEWNLYYKSIVVIGIPKNKIKVKFDSNEYETEQDIVSINDLEVYMNNLIYDREETLYNKGSLLTDSQVLELYNYIYKTCSNVEEEIKTEHAIRNNY